MKTKVDQGQPGGAYLTNETSNMKTGNETSDMKTENGTSDMKTGNETSDMKTGNGTSVMMVGNEPAIPYRHTYYIHTCNDSPKIRSQQTLGLYHYDVMGVKGGTKWSKYMKRACFCAIM